MNQYTEPAKTLALRILISGMTPEIVAELESLYACRAVAEMVVAKVESGRMASRETYALAKAAWKK